MVLKNGFTKIKYIYKLDHRLIPVLTIIRPFLQIINVDGLMSILGTKI